MSKYLVLLVLSFLILLGGCTNNDHIEVTPTSEPTSTPMQLDPDDKIYQDLVDMINIHSIFYGVSEYLYNSDYITADTIDNGKKLAIAIFHATDDQVLSDPTKEEMDILVKDVFGPDATHIDEDFDLGTYDEETGKYMLAFGVGGAFVPYYEYGIEKEVKDHDLLMIDEVVIKIRPEPLADDYSEDMMVKSDILSADGNTLLDTREHPLSEEASFLEDYRDVASVYRYIFKDIDGKYYFDSFEKIS